MRPFGQLLFWSSGDTDIEVVVTRQICIFVRFLLLVGMLFTNGRSSHATTAANSSSSASDELKAVSKASSHSVNDLAAQACTPGKVLDTCIDWTQKPGPLAAKSKAFNPALPCESLGAELLRNCQMKTKTTTSSSLRDLMICSLRDAPKRFGLKLRSESVCSTQYLSQMKEEL